MNFPANPYASPRNRPDSEAVQPRRVPGDIEIHRTNAELCISCGDETFARLRNAVIKEACLAEETSGPFADLWQITIAKRQPHVQPSRLRDRIGLLGCAIVGFAILFVFVAGVAAIAGWFR